MTIHIQTQSAHGGSYTDLDLSTVRLCDMVPEFAYGQAAKLTFTALHPQHTLPLGIGLFVRMWDDAAAGQSSSAPWFEGFVEEGTPGSEANEVHYTCYDPTYRVGARFPIMSEDWVAGVGSDPPTKADGSYPRRVWNSTIDNDDDYAYEQFHGGTLGQIIADVLDSQYEALAFFNAANESTGLAYVATDLDALTFIPQEKMVAENESVRSFIERALSQYDPAFRLVFQPGTREWRIVKLTSATQVDLALGDYTVDDVVLSLDLNASRAGRWTAVKIYGPQQLTQAIASTEDSSLSVVASGHLLQNNIATCCDVEGQNAWQIVDASKRRISRRLAEQRNVQVDDFNVSVTMVPWLEGYWPLTSAGAAGWRPIPNWVWDTTGTISIPWGYVYRYNASPASGEPNYENPTNVRLIYAYPDSEISVRYPATGFAGTAYTVDGLENELAKVDPMLAVGYERGVPVTISDRQDQFAILAQKLHDYVKDIIYTGGCVLDGIRHEYSTLNRRINLVAIDADGDPLTTGWEAINAYLTSVSFNLADQTTTLQFSDDQAELIGMDVEQMKQRLNIRAMTLKMYYSYGFNTTIRNRRFGDKSGFHFAGDVLETTMWTQVGGRYEDEFGNTTNYDPTALDRG